MGGFTDWVGQIDRSKSTREYHRHVSDAESASMWQSLSFGANYKSAYCLAACPAGEDVIGPFLTDRSSFVHEVVKPLQEKIDTVYVVPGSDKASILTPAKDEGEDLPGVVIDRMPQPTRFLRLAAFDNLIGVTARTKYRKKYHGCCSPSDEDISMAEKIVQCKSATRPKLHLLGSFHP